MGLRDCQSLDRGAEISLTAEALEMENCRRRRGGRISRRCDRGKRVKRKSAMVSKIVREGRVA